jgi:hypothetical protein
MKRPTRRALLQSTLGVGGGYVVGTYGVDPSSPDISIGAAMLGGLLTYYLFLSRERRLEPQRVSDDVSETLRRAGVACSGAHPTGYAIAHLQYALYLFEQERLEDAERVAQVALEAGSIEQELLTALTIGTAAIEGQSTVSTQDRPRSEPLERTNDSLVVAVLRRIRVGAYDEARYLCGTSKSSGSESTYNDSYEMSRSDILSRNAS